MKLSGAPEFRHFDAEEAAQMAREAAAAKDRAHRVAIAAAAEALGATSKASATAPATAPRGSTDVPENPAAFVPRRRPALPPTRAQREAAAAAGVPLPAPGQPLDPPRVISSDAEPAPAPAFIPRRRPALPPRRGDGATGASPGFATGASPGFAPNASPGFEPATASAPTSALARTPAPSAIALDRDAQRSRLLNRMSAEARASVLDDPGGRGRGRGGRGGRGGGGSRPLWRLRGTRKSPSDPRTIRGEARRAGDGGGRRGVGAAASARAEPRTSRR